MLDEICLLAYNCFLFGVPIINNDTASVGSDNDHPALVDTSTPATSPTFSLIGALQNDSVYTEAEKEALLEANVCYHYQAASPELRAHFVGINISLFQNLTSFEKDVVKLSQLSVRLEQNPAQGNSIREEMKVYLYRCSATIQIITALKTACGYPNWDPSAVNFLVNYVNCLPAATADNDTANTPSIPGINRHFSS